MIDLVIDLLLLVALTYLGGLLVGGVGDRDGRPLAFATSFPLGAGAFSLSLFAISWIGVRLTPWSCAAVLLVLLAAGWRWRRTAWPPAWPGPPTPSEPGQEGPFLRWDFLPLAAFGLLASAAALLAVFRGYSTWDAAAIWSAKGYGIAHEGRIFAGAEWGGHGLSYPLNLPLLIAATTLFGGDPLPTSKLLFPLFYLSLSLGAYGFWRKGSVPWPIAGSAGLLLATIPLVFRHAQIGYANLALTTYLILGAAWMALGFARAAPGSLALGSSLLGLAAWTRVEGGLYSIVIAGLLMLPHARKQDRVQLSVTWGPLLFVLASWGTFFLLYGRSGSQALVAGSDLVRAWLQGTPDLHPLRLIFGYFRRSVVVWSTWGLFFPALGAVLVAGLFAARTKSRAMGRSLIVAGLGAAVVVGLLYYGVFYVSPDYLAWLRRDFPRAFLPTAGLLWLGAVQWARGGPGEPAGLSEPN